LQRALIETRASPREKLSAQTERELLEVQPPRAEGGRSNARVEEAGAAEGVVGVLESAPPPPLPPPPPLDPEPHAGLRSPEGYGPGSWLGCLFSFGTLTTH
jgi:hypothetical protein